MNDIPASGLALVDFWADWCAPCKQLSPILDEVAAELPELALVKVNIEDDPALVTTLGVQSVPTLVLIKDGVPVDRFGALSKSALLAKLSEYL